MNNPRGFALASSRNPSQSRYDIQVPPDHQVEDWPDDRFPTAAAHEDALQAA